MPPSSTDAALPAGFCSVATAHPDRTAIVGARRLDGVLRRPAAAGSTRSRTPSGPAGCRGGRRVAGVLHNGREYLEVLLATGQVGMYFVPVNYRLAADEIAYVVRDSGAGIVVADAEQAATLAPRRAAGRPVRGPRRRRGLGGVRGPRRRPAHRRAAGPAVGHLHGLHLRERPGGPKGVRVRLRDWAPEQYAAMLIGNIVEAYGVAPGEGVHLVCSPLYHSAPGSHALAFLHAGHTLLVHSGFDAAATLRDIEARRVTSTHMVPTHFHRLLALPEEVRARADLTSLGGRRPRRRSVPGRRQAPHDRVAGADRLGVPRLHRGHADPGQLAGVARPAGHRRARAARG